MQRYLGLDVHAASSRLVVRSESGKRLGQSVIETPGQALIEAIRMIPGPRRLCLEEGTQSAWLYEILSPHVTETVVAMVRRNPAQNSGALDAHGLAEKLRSGQIERAVFKASGQFSLLRERARMHRSLGYRPPAPEAIEWQPSGGAGRSLTAAAGLTQGLVRKPGAGSPHDPVHGKPGAVWKALRDAGAAPAPDPEWGARRDLQPRSDADRRGREAKEVRADLPTRRTRRVEQRTHRPQAGVAPYRGGDQAGGGGAGQRPMRVRSPERTPLRVARLPRVPPQAALGQIEAPLGRGHRAALPGAQPPRGSDGLWSDAHGTLPDQQSRERPDTNSPWGEFGGAVR
jgi:hypothetical protein